jgi:hypothetical protein
VLRLRGGGGALYIVMPDGSELTMEWNPNGSIESVKQFVCRREEMEMEEFDICYNSQVLD